MKPDWRLIRFSAIAVLYGAVLFSLAAIEFPASASVGSWLANTMLPLSLGAGIALLGVMAMFIRKDRMIGMIGIHAGLLVALVAPIALSWHGWSLWSQSRPVSQYVPMFITAAFGGFAFAAMLRTRPPKEARGTSEASPHSLN
jgi:hypothetical protein